MNFHIKAFLPALPELPDIATKQRRNLVASSALAIGIITFDVQICSFPIWGTTLTGINTSSVLWMLSAFILYQAVTYALAVSSAWSTDIQTQRSHANAMQERQRKITDLIDELYGKGLTPTTSDRAFRKLVLDVCDAQFGKILDDHRMKSHSINTIRTLLIDGLAPLLIVLYATFTLHATFTQGVPSGSCKELDIPFANVSREPTSQVCNTVSTASEAAPSPGDLPQLPQVERPSSAAQD